MIDRAAQGVSIRGPGITSGGLSGGAVSQILTEARRAELICGSQRQMERSLGGFDLESNRWPRRIRNSVAAFKLLPQLIRRREQDT